MDEGKKNKVLLGILIVLVITLVGLMFLIYNQLKSARNVKDDELAGVTVTNTVNDNVSVTYNLGSPAAADVEILEDVKDVANRYMQARLEKNLESAKPYMTKKFADETTQEEFAPASSSTMDKFEITEAQAVKTPNTYLVEVLSYWLTNGRDAGKLLDTLIIKRDGDMYLVDEVKPSDRPM